MIETYEIERVVVEGFPHHDSPSKNHSCGHTSLGMLSTALFFAARCNEY